MAADSGAYDHVVRKDELPGYDVIPSAMSQSGESYVGAGGEDIPNLGQVKVECKMQDGQDGFITVQKAKVHRNLASISKMVKAGNKVVFDEVNGRNASYLFNKRLNTMTPIRHNGIYEFDIWVKNKSKYGQYGVLAKDHEEEDDHNADGKAKCEANTIHLDFHGHA